MKVYPALALIPCLLAAPVVAAADIGEEVFKNALRYTVQVRTMLPIPFDGDRKGSGLGAGFVDYYCHIKEAEIARFNLEVSEWEHREYFDLL